MYWCVGIVFHGSYSQMARSYYCLHCNVKCGATHVCPNGVLRPVTDVQSVLMAKPTASSLARKCLFSGKCPRSRLDEAHEQDDELLLEDTDEQDDDANEQDDDANE